MVKTYLKPGEVRNMNKNLEKYVRSTFFSDKSNKIEDTAMHSNRTTHYGKFDTN